MICENITKNSTTTFFSMWPFLFCFVPKTVYGPNFFELFAKVFRILRPRGNFFDDPIFFQNLADSAAIRLVQKSWKSEPSSPFFGRLKFRRKFGPCELLQNFLCGYKIEMAKWFSLRPLPVHPIWKSKNKSSMNLALPQHDMHINTHTAPCKNFS